MKKKTKKVKKENKQVVEIHVYVHQQMNYISPPQYPAGGTGTWINTANC